MVRTRLLEIPVNVEPIQVIRSMRLIAESNNWNTTRIEDTKMVHRWAIIVPITSQARVIGFKVNSNQMNNFTIRSWSQTPGSAGKITYVSFEIPQNIEGNVWDNGELYDPKKGKTYSGKITLTDKNTLDLRGYIGFSFIGRSSTWTRKTD